MGWMTEIEKTENRIQFAEANGASKIAQEARVVLAGLKEEEEEKEAAREAAKKIEAARVAQVYATAKETGVAQILEKHEDYCNDPREDCNMDIVTVIVKPDGSTITERDHTW